MFDKWVSDGGAQIDLEELGAQVSFLKERYKLSELPLDVPEQDCEDLMEDSIFIQQIRAGTSDRRWLHGDERGSVVATSDGTGNMLAINRYDEYGIPAAGNVGRFQYTGQTWLPELGMYNYKARIYSPTLGRFMQTDPIGYDDGLNWYNYVGSDPINATDPSGLAFEFCTGSRLCQKDGSGGTISSGWVASSLGPSQGGIAARGPGSLTVTCANCGSSGVLSSDDLGPLISVMAPTYTLAYSPSAFFLIATTGTARQEKPQSDKPSTLEKLGQCTSGQLGLGELAEAAAVAAGQPIPGTKPFVTPGSSQGTSAAGMAADKLLGKTRLPVRLPTIVGGPGTGRALAIAGTKSAARFAGRAVPIVGWALLAYDAASISICTASSE